MNLISIKEAAAYLQVSPMTTYRMARTGELPALKVGGHWRIAKDRLDEKIQKLLEWGEEKMILPSPQDSNYTIGRRSRIASGRSAKGRGKRGNKN